jgi:photosystem II stability/assembly factor-like uncharacterized protein
MFAGTLWGGVLKSTDGGYNWTSCSQGLPDGHIYSLAINRQGVMFAGTEYFGLYVSTNNGNFWQSTKLKINKKIRSIVINQDGVIFAGTDGHGIYKSTDGGWFWENFSAPENINCMAVSDYGYIFAAAKLPHVLYMSTDEGLSWSAADSSEHAYNSVAAAPNGYIYAITGNLITDALLGDKLICSTDNGNSWNVQYSFASSSYGMTINMLNHIFIGKYQNVYMSTDGGSSFSVLSSGITHPNNEKIITLGCDSAGYVFLGQELGAVYRSVYPTIGIKKLSNEVPKDFRLYQNYPNPFNPSTTIKFEIPFSPFEGGKGDVKLVIYDISGKIIETLLDKEIYAGSYSADWNAYDFSSGIYFYSISVNGIISDTKKMILLK